MSIDIFDNKDGPTAIFSLKISGSNEKKLHNAIKETMKPPIRVYNENEYVQLDQWF